VSIEVYIKTISLHAITPTAQIILERFPHQVLKLEVD